MPVSLDIYGGLMAQNNKAISEKAYNFHSATSSIREIAEWFIDTLGLDSVTNLKTVDSVKKLIDDTMAPNRPSCELGFINSYADKNTDKTVDLFLSKDTYVLCDEHNKATPTLSLSVKDMWKMNKSVYSNLDKPKAPTNKYGVAGESLKAHIKEPRATALNDVKVTFNRLKKAMRSIVKANCNIKTDTSNVALTSKANNQVGSLYNLFESLKDDKAIVALKSLPKKYLNKIS
tara:strand:- start:234 stop:929 length:696 start_codon:yes stop_codon:yes gene_type:complete